MTSSRHAVLESDLSILHPSTRLPIGLIITISASRLEKLNFELFSKRLSLLGNKKRLKKFRRKLTRKECLSLVCGCTLGWRTEVKDDDRTSSFRPEVELEKGLWLPFSQQNAQRLYAEVSWVMEQVDVELGRLDDTASSRARQRALEAFGFPPGE